MDTMDFVKRAWATLDLSSPFAPTLNVEELDKRIADLRAVEQWLALNQGMLRNTIQGLEIQRGTLAAVQGLTDSFGRLTRPPGEDTAEALARFAAATVQPPVAPVQPPMAAARPAPASPAGGETAGPPAAPAPDASPGALPWGGNMDPLAWWKVLQGNFEQIARMAGARPAGDTTTPATRDAPAAGGRRKTAATGSAGTKPAPRGKGRRARGAPANAGGAAGAKSGEGR
jgi:hypothetical protein